MQAQAQRRTQMLDEAMHEKSRSTQAQAQKADAPVISRSGHTLQVCCVSQVQAQAELSTIAWGKHKSGQQAACSS